MKNLAALNVALANDHWLAFRANGLIYNGATAGTMSDSNLMFYLN